MKRPKNALMILSDEDSSSAGSLFSAASDEEDELAIETKPLSLLANFLVSATINIHPSMFLTNIMSCMEKTAVRGDNLNDTFQPPTLQEM